ncbi:MAG TPA: BrxA/BrxB family bacilliredoxin [Bryobacteraceae bacterium]|nr:BrxA/BrxB family bacilliredoxin [Bryobacteraceae bacterium]HPT25323.1 BrxA/BrxB family bacilliredoxin [Bryobacteraceae bacterium]
MPYSEVLITPMREDLTRHGVLETRTPEDVDRTISSHQTVLMVTNSVCGCAAGKARPAVVMAMQSAVRPDVAATVFAGGDLEAAAHLRHRHLHGIPPSSPSMALFRAGKLVWALHRFQIESSTAPEIAETLRQAFAEHCAQQPS